METHNESFHSVDCIVEKTGGLFFEVTLKEADGESPFKPIENKKPLSERQLAEKLAKADERRLSLQSLKAASDAKDFNLRVYKERLQEEAENRLKQIELDLEIKEQNRQKILQEKRQASSQKFQKVTEIKEKLTEAEIAKKKLLEEQVQQDLMAKEMNRLKMLEERRLSTGNDFKRALEVKARQIEEEELKKKKVQEQLLADLDIKEANRAKKLEEKILTLQKRSSTRPMNATGDN